MFVCSTTQGYIYIYICQPIALVALVALIAIVSLIALVITKEIGLCPPRSEPNQPSCICCRNTVYIHEYIYTRKIKRERLERDIHTYYTYTYIYLHTSSSKKNTEPLIDCSTIINTLAGINMELKLVCDVVRYLVSRRRSWMHYIYIYK